MSYMFPGQIKPIRLAPPKFAITCGGEELPIDCGQADDNRGVSHMRPGNVFGNWFAPPQLVVCSCSKQLPIPGGHRGDLGGMTDSLPTGIEELNVTIIKFLVDSSYKGRTVSVPRKSDSTFIVVAKGESEA